MNWVGCALGGSRQDAPTHAVAALKPFSGPPQASLFGRKERLDEQHMAWALGNAASQPVGLKVQFGSDTKSFHPGKAAQNGMLSALLAQQGFTASDVAIEGFDGWGQAVSTRHDWNEVTQGLGERYETGLNTYKPFACGIVAHPAIDAAIQLRAANAIKPEQIASVELKAHALTLNLMGKTEPRTGPEGKFSIYRATAVAQVTGRGGDQAFRDAAVNDPAVAAVRKKVVVTVDPAIKPDQVDMTVTLVDGRKLHQFIEHAVGSQRHPMSDAQLEEKFSGQAEGILAPERSRRLMALCRKTWDLADAGDIARAAAAALGRVSPSPCTAPPGSRSGRPRRRSSGPRASPWTPAPAWRRRRRRARPRRARRP